MSRVDKEFLRRNFWALPVGRVLDVLGTDECGLTEEEAKKRLVTFGENRLPVGGRIGRFSIFFNQFKSPLIVILLVAGSVTFILGDFRDGSFIFAALLVNVLLGFYQENKAEGALAGLQTYIRERARVVRDDRGHEIGAEEVVPGDILKLMPGTRIPADARLISVNDFSVDESVLTGESLPVTDKSARPVKVTAGVADQKSMVFAGTLVGGGLALAAVTATGEETELGRIATLVRERERTKTPLQQAISGFAFRASLFLAGLVAVLFVIGMASGYGLFEMFLTSVAVAVAAVPEGLPIAMTVVLAVGVERLAKRRGVVRKLLAAETLGGTTLILTDKTGTLTEAKMELEKIVGEGDKTTILKEALLNVDVVVENPKDSPERWRVSGRPLEAALVQAAAKHKVLLPDVTAGVEILDRRPFNSKDKFSAVEVKGKGRKHWTYLGAPEVVLDQARLAQKEKKRILMETEMLASAGHRVLGVASGKKFLGLLAFRDPVRPSAGKAIKQIFEAGVKTVIATGDHRGTAVAVARELGITCSAEEVVEGEELKKLTDEELSARLGTVKIFARVTPEDKLRIACLYKEKGEVVAVTGDGVNDAPALKEADIGVAVGSGTSVAKGAADLVILDDNFETIVAAVSEGRRILENIRKVILYLFTDVFDELVLIGGAILTGLPLPLNALQILWVNFFSDSFPAVALAFENGTDHLRHRPSSLKKQLLDKEMKFLIMVVGTVSSLFLFGLYVGLLRLGFDGELVRSFIFASFSMYTMFVIFSFRSLRKSIFEYNLFSNRYLVGGVSIGIFLTIVAIYLPFLQGLLGTVTLPPLWALGVILVALINVAAIEVVKWWFRKRG